MHLFAVSLPRDLFDMTPANPEPALTRDAVQHKGDEQITLLWRLWRVFGRFYWARRLLGKYFGSVSLAARRHGKISLAARRHGKTSLAARRHGKTSLAARRHGKTSLAAGNHGKTSDFQLQPAQPALFSSAAIEPSVAALHRDAVAFGFNLAPEMVAAISDFAHTTPLIQENYPERDFSYTDCQSGAFSDGAPIPLAYAKNARLCPEVMAIVNDPVILEIAARYLGFRPKYFRDRLWFSFTGNHDLATRRQMNQTVDFHFDLPGSQFTFFYISFYLSDVDLQSGAHTLIKGSHRKKPLWLKLGSSRRSVDALAKVYGKDFDTVISGPAGTGFLEDASCYHRALAPISRERLMLQIRYF